MDVLSDIIAAAALILSILTAIYARSESEKARAERVESRVREILVGIQRPLILGVNSARITIDFDEPPEMFREYDTSGLKELAPRLRRKSDRETTKGLADDINTVGAHWMDTISAYGWWQEACQKPADPGAIPLPTPMPAQLEFDRFAERRDVFIEKAEKLQEDIKSFVAKIDARYR